MSISAFSKTALPIGCEEGTRNKWLLYLLHTELYLVSWGKDNKNYETMRNLHRLVGAPVFGLLFTRQIFKMQS